MMMMMMMVVVVVVMVMVIRWWLLSVFFRCWMLSQLHHIHHIMTTLIVSKVLSLLFESVMYHFIRLHGHTDGWSTVYYIFAFVKGSFTNTSG